MYPNKASVVVSAARYFVAALAVWFIYTVGGALWHEVIFANWYHTWTHEIVRLQMPIGFFMLTHAMRATVFVYVFSMLYKGGDPITKGLKFGFLMGVFTGLMVTSYYGDFQISSPGWAVMEFAYNIVRAVLGGLAVGLIVRRREEITVAQEQ